jgi:hypothetical protein
MTRMSRWMWIALVLALGCGKKDDAGPSCVQVADHVNEIATKAYPGHGEMMPAGSRKNYVAGCEARKLTGKQRRCMVEAQSMEALAACLPRDKAEEPKPGAPPPPGAPAPAPATGAPPPSGAPPAASGGPAPSGTPPAASGTPPPASAPPAAPAPTSK